MDQKLFASVSLEVEEGVLDDDRLVQAAQVARDKSGAIVVASSDGRLVDWSFRFEATENPVELAGSALNIVEEALREVGVVDWTFARVAAVSEDEQRRESRRTSPAVGMAEAADLLGVTRQRIHQYIQQGRFPQPVAELRAGPVWARDDVLSFGGTRKTRGRPRSGSL